MLAPAIPVPQARANRLQIVFERSRPVRQVERLFEVCREASAKSSSIKKALVVHRPPGTGARRPPGDLDVDQEGSGGAAASRNRSEEAAGRSRRAPASTVQPPASGGAGWSASRPGSGPGLRRSGLDAALEARSAP
jgi:hypothetical protein